MHLILKSSHKYRTPIPHNNGMIVRMTHDVDHGLSTSVEVSYDVRGGGGGNFTKIEI